jgi:hypothetical protein
MKRTIVALAVCLAALWASGPSVTSQRVLFVALSVKNEFQWRCDAILDLLMSRTPFGTGLPIRFPGWHHGAPDLFSENKRTSLSPLNRIRMNSFSYER